ncbi:hypothetical protein GGI23_000344 [Coemansia sp. RSA 2559]|nr:hypothetical protein GGI23_000344 [Coemansia sp. RSA 2559]KAJ2869389.1 hypothetical protein GGI22_000287 [Coemansia erecta]
MKFSTVSAAIAAVAATASADTIAPTMGQHLCCAANQARQQAGIPLLQWHPALDSIATTHSRYMMSTDQVTHFEVNDSSTYSLAQRLGTINYSFSTAGENIASGFSSVPSVQAAWMDSPGHKANILGTGFNVCGGGVAFSDPTTGYYTVDFTAPLESANDNTYYTLTCANGLSQGATKGGSTPDAHAAQTPAATHAAAAAPSSTVVVQKQSAAAPAPEPTAAVAATPQATPSNAPMVPAPSSPGKCKRVPKGSIAAGKCKACSKCASSANRRRR